MEMFFVFSDALSICVQQLDVFIVICAFNCYFLIFVYLTVISPIFNCHFPHTFIQAQNTLSTKYITNTDCTQMFKSAFGAFCAYL